MSIEKTVLHDILNTAENSEAVERIRAAANWRSSLVIVPTSVNFPFEGDDKVAVVRVDDEEFRKIFGSSEWTAELPESSQCLWSTPLFHAEVTDTIDATAWSDV